MCCMSSKLLFFQLRINWMYFVSSQLWLRLRCYFLLLQPRIPTVGRSMRCYRPSHILQRWLSIFKRSMCAMFNWLLQIDSGYESVRTLPKQSIYCTSRLDDMHTMPFKFSLIFWVFDMPMQRRISMDW